MLDNSVREVTSKVIEIRRTDSNSEVEGPGVFAGRRFENCCEATMIARFRNKYNGKDALENATLCQYNFTNGRRNMRAKTLSMGVQMGGVGRTTATAVLCYILSQIKKQKVLAVDFDSTGKLTHMLTQHDIYYFSGKTSFEAVKAMDPRSFITKINEDLDLLPADDHLATLPHYLYTSSLNINPAMLLSKTLDKVKNDYDWIIIDLPPNSGDLVTNGLVASDYSLAIFRTEQFSYLAIRPFLESIMDIQDTLNPDLQLLGIVPSVNSCKSTSADEAVLETAKREYGNMLFNTVIYWYPRIKEWSESGITYSSKNQQDKESMSQYLALVAEMM